MAKEKESKIEDLLEGSNTENVKSDTQVSPVGEEVPEGLEPEVTTIEPDLISEDVPTPSEPEPEPAPVEEGTPELSPIEQAFYAKGLDKQFKSVEDMMNRVPEMNKHIDNLSVERKQLRELKEQAPQKEPVKAPSAEDFYNDPVGIIDKMVAQKQEEVNRRFDEMEVNSFMRSKSDFNEMAPLMEEQLDQNPHLRKKIPGERKEYIFPRPRK